MNPDALKRMTEQAQARLREFVNRSAGQHLRKMRQDAAKKGGQ